MVNIHAWEQLVQEMKAAGATLIAVSKTKPVSDIEVLYAAGQRDFGENYVQELTEKEAVLPKDIRWHYIGHLQGNKVKFIAPFVHMVHAVDSYKLLTEINKHAQKNNRVTDVLLQMYIAEEESKFGMDEQEINVLLASYKDHLPKLQNVRICGLMGMATNTSDEAQVRKEFGRLSNFKQQLAAGFFEGSDYFKECSMGMTADYKIALEEGSTMIRVGSLLFGSR